MIRNGSVWFYFPLHSLWWQFLLFSWQNSWFFHSIKLDLPTTSPECFFLKALLGVENWVENDCGNANFTSPSAWAFIFTYTWMKIAKVRRGRKITVKCNFGEQTNEEKVIGKNYGRYLRERTSEEMLHGCSICCHHLHFLAEIMYHFLDTSVHGERMTSRVHLLVSKNQWST